MGLWSQNVVSPNIKQQEDTMQSKWIPNYKGYYSVREDGAVYAHSRIVNGKVRKARWKTATKDKNGYYYVKLHKNGVTKSLQIHRLVAICFKHSDYKEHLQVNHIDEDKSNNHYSNLEWCTAQYNTEYSQAKTYKLVNKGKIVEVFNLRKFCRENQLDYSCMRKVLKGERSHHNGWQKHEEKS